jgi:hypothetical protein
MKAVSVLGALLIVVLVRPGLCVVEPPALASSFSASG